MYLYNARILITEKLRTLFLKDPSKPLFWIVLGVLIKGLPFFFLLHNRPPSDMPGVWAATSPDTLSYMDPIENLLKDGSYFPDYRMPGYGVIYLFFRVLFSPDYSCNMLLVLQFILAGVSVYYLALTARAIFKNDKIFYISFYLFLFSTYSNFYDGWLLTESLCSSAMIFSAWFFVKYFQSGRVRNLLISGILLTWIIFLRPVFLPLIFLFAFILLFTRKTSIIPSGGKRLALVFFVLPFLLCESVWIVRNYYKHQKIILLTSSELAPRAANFYEISLNDFIRSWGGSADYTDNNSPLLWFGFHIEGMPNPKDFKGSLPDYIYTSRFNEDSLVRIKNKVIALNDSILSPEERHSYQNMVEEKLGRYATSIKEEKPFLYYVKAPFFYCLPRFLVGPEVKLYMKRFQITGAIGSVTQSIFTFYYCVVLVLGITGICMLVFQGVLRNPLVLIIACIPIYTILVHAIILRVTSNRFLMPAWAFLLVCAAYTIFLILSFCRKKVRYFQDKKEKSL